MPRPAAVPKGTTALNAPRPLCEEAHHVEAAAVAGAPVGARGRRVADDHAVKERQRRVADGRGAGARLGVEVGRDEGVGLVPLRRALEVVCTLCVGGCGCVWCVVVWRCVVACVQGRGASMCHSAAAPPAAPRAFCVAFCPSLMGAVSLPGRYSQPSGTRLAFLSSSSVSSLLSRAFLALKEVPEMPEPMTTAVVWVCVGARGWVGVRGWACVAGVCVFDGGSTRARADAATGA